MSETNAETVWLTQKACGKLEAEFTRLGTVDRPEVIVRIAAAREEDDLSENDGYHAAREEWGQMEGRARQLEYLSQRVQVGEIQGDPDEIGPGRIVIVAFFGDDDDTDTSPFGPREIFGTDSSVNQVVSSQSPLGVAVPGHRMGDGVSYAAPNGRIASATIRKVTP